MAGVGVIGMGRSAKRTTRGALLRRERSAASFVPYARHLDGETIITRDGLLLSVIALDGFAAETADEEELLHRKSVRDLAIRTLGTSEWAIAQHTLRRVVSPSIASPVRGAYAQALDGRYQAALSARRLFEDRHYLTLMRRPLQGNAGFMEEITRLVRGAGSPEAAQRCRTEAQRALRDAARSLCATLERYGPRLLTTHARDGELWSEPLGFLSGLLNGRLPASDALPLPRSDLASALPARRMVFRNELFESRGAAHDDVIFGAAIAVREYPPRTWPGMLDALLALPHELTISQSFALVDRPVAIARIHGVQGRMRGAEDAASLAADLSAAADDAAAGRAAFGLHAVTIVPQADSPRALDRAVADIVAALGYAGIVGVREDLGLEPAFWAQLPGNFAFAARKALISSANFAGLAALHGRSSGAKHSPWGPPIAMLETTAGGPYRFSFHVGDLGNTIVIGPSGSGKTVLLNFLVAQTSRIPDARVVFFDKDRGAEIAIRALGGRYRILKPGAPAGLSPLTLPDTPDNRAFLVAWLARLAQGADGAPASAADMRVLVEAVAALYAAPTEARRLSAMAPLFKGHERAAPGALADRLSRWSQGDRAWLFETPAEDGLGALFADHTVEAFDLTHLFDDPDARTAALMALFRAVDAGLDGRPTLIVLDEGWRLLDDPVFEAQIKDWEKTVRKKNGALVFATQSAGDALASRVGAAIIEQSPTQIFFPNLKADANAYCGGFGLTPREFEIVRTLPDTSRAFLLKQGGASVVARLDLDGLDDDLAVLSGRAGTTALLDRIREDIAASHGPRAADDPTQWLPEFHRRRRAP